MERVNFFCRSFAALAAVMLSANLLCSCGDNNNDFTRKTPRTTVTAAGEAVPVSADSESLGEIGGESGELTDGGQETSAAQTTAPQTEASAETTTLPPKPVGLKTDLLDGHSYSIEKFPHKTYSNTKLKKALKKIDDICADYGYTISFCYKNMDTGAVIRYNENVKYGVCSTVKAPFCKELLERGIDLDDKITVSVIWDGDGGEVAIGGYGKEYTARELIRLAITKSDNSAYYNLIEHYGYQGFNNMNYKLGVGYDLGYSWIFNYGSAEDLLKQYEDIYKYAKKSKRGEWLTKLMTKTDLEGQITEQLSGKYQVSHKYGSDWDQNAYHDCAICYADSPFVLVIMTNQIPETEDSDEVFHRLAKWFDVINSTLVVE